MLTRERIIKIAGVCKMRPCFENDLTQDAVLDMIFRKFHHRMPSARLLVLCLVGLLGALPIPAQDDIDAIPQPRPRPMPTAVMAQADLTLEFYFPSIMQGGLGLLRLQAVDVRQARALFLDEESPFFPVEGDVWYAFAVAGMNARARNYDLTVIVEKNDGDIIAFNRNVKVESAGYITQNFNIPGDRSNLVDRQVEQAEFAKLDAMTAEITPEPLWDAVGFALPLNAKLSSPFGAYRTLNETMQTRHTGWDQRAAVGTPIKSVAAGAVVFAGRLDIRGHYVMIDHGRGVYSGYAHFSETHVARGQRIAAGQVIGMSGNSGRSSGPHLHWEMSVNGEWIDGLSFIEMWLPS